MICLLHLKDYLPANFVKTLSIIMTCKTDWGKTQKTTSFLVDFHFFFLEHCNMLSKCHSTEIKTVSDKNYCNPHVFLLWRVGKLRASGVVSVMPKTLRWHQNEAQEKSAQCSNQLVNQELVIMSRKKSHKIGIDSITITCSITKLLLRTMFIQPAPSAPKF